VYSAELEHTHQFNDEVSLLVAGYLSEMTDLIYLANVPGDAASGQLVQEQNRPFPVHAAGGEIELRWQAGPGVLFSAWYAYTVVREDQGAWFQGTTLPNSPTHTGAVRALYPLVPQALSLSTEVIYGGPRHAIPNDDGSEGALIGEQLIWNLGISGEFAPWGLRYGAFVNNLLDQRVSLPGGPEICSSDCDPSSTFFPNHAVPQYGRMLRLQLSGSF
jgi:outer membrane receptor protein involved in Fe transport